MKATRKNNALAWLRRECRSLTDVKEKTAWGHPTFQVGGRTIAAFETFHGRPSIAVLANREYQEFLVKQFGVFKTPHSGRSGWVSAWVDIPAPWKLIRSLLAEAHKSESARLPRAAVASARKRSKKPVGRSKPNRSV
jgi:predicted DNA-binding protein (MmcQ/YjbR family)